MTELWNCFYCRRLVNNWLILSPDTLADALILYHMPTESGGSSPQAFHTACWEKWLIEERANAARSGDQLKATLLQEGAAL